MRSNPPFNECQRRSASLVSEMDLLPKGLRNAAYAHQCRSSNQHCLGHEQHTVHIFKNISHRDYHNYLLRPVTPVPILAMLSDTHPETPDPSIVLGPRKRCPTQRLRENGNPLACKRARKGATSAAPRAGMSEVSPVLRVLDGAIGATVSMPAANRPLFTTSLMATPR